MPYIVGFAGLIVLWIILRLAAGSNLSSLFIGEDGRPSTSKAQLLAWTAVLVFSYLAIYAIRVRMGQFAPLPFVPENVLIALGISGATAVSAKAIALNSASNAAPVAPTPGLPAVPPAIPSRSGILLGDSGTPDLGKVQIIIWTIIALGVYFITVAHSIHKGTADLPDIDRNLMILMGIGHSVYIGKKVAES